MHILNRYLEPLFFLVLEEKKLDELNTSKKKVFNSSNLFSSKTKKQFSPIRIRSWMDGVITIIQQDLKNY